ncbi:type 1 glutamine amidotransferase [Nocardioides mangrovi]|uniref:Type 1 glutamine amidotransferase n=1 Tax=Nocardioides mangrovi TaxID=2874580 RepID=A0ABS7UHE9_9ACTN|nr:type 1 glutamine amidotransferase [Nocardioides mangrovi]MBZ5740302.1 type 1 glutamine amidotransferase [Nocardioides mangrovi]
MSAPRVLVVEHDHECPPAWLGSWLAEAGCEIEVCRPYDGDELPGLAAYDALLILGGPMGANDDEKHAWIGPVKDLVREARVTGVPTLGVCLGHQLVAAALGGTVEVNPLGQQVGLLGVGWTAAAAGDRLLGPLATPRRGVQWNDDVVTALPADAVLLAETDRGEVQAARYGELMWGVQLHPEVDDVVLRPWAEEDRGSHETRGIDTDGLLRDVASARTELDDAWRPLAASFAALAREHAAR